MALKYKNIDLGDNKSQKIPYGERKHIAFLIGSGFSVPCGMPTGKQLNTYILNIEDAPITFDFTGKLAFSSDGIKHPIGSQYDRCLSFCSLMMKEYNKSHNFDYEQFYDFIKSNDIFEQRYVNLSKAFVSDYPNYHQLIIDMLEVYTQIIEYKLREGRKTELKEGEFACEKFERYESFTKFLDYLAQEYVVDIFLLNHDFLIENLYRTNWLHETISDGFHNYRSKFYGELECNGTKYDCRLEEYKGYYNSAIRLYKLHGSLDYLMFKCPNIYGNFRLDKMIKIPYGIAIDQTKKQSNHKLEYDKDWIEYHPNFLSGSFSKIAHYKDSFYKILFKKFKKNLQKAKILIIIGYGGRDCKINQYIQENFDYSNKQSFIYDPYFDNNKELQRLAEVMNAKPIRVSIDNFVKPSF